MRLWLYDLALSAPLLFRYRQNSEACESEIVIYSTSDYRKGDDIYYYFTVLVGQWVGFEPLV